MPSRSTALATSSLESGWWAGKLGSTSLFIGGSCRRPGSRSGSSPGVVRWVPPLPTASGRESVRVVGNAVKGYPVPTRNPEMSGRRDLLTVSRPCGSGHHPQAGCCDQRLQNRAFRLRISTARGKFRVLPATLRDPDSVDGEGSRLTAPGRPTCGKSVPGGIQFIGLSG